ncbi:MAG TPA: transcription elongation factor GreA [Solirubrobacterales bacterium]|nr:transcription elongation factor GreA [Solirubrobacterales bacterium]
MSNSEQSGESITAEGILALQAEIERLEGPAREEIANRLRVARDLGDLKENAEYHIAKEDQAHLETNINRLRQRLINAEVVDPDQSTDTFSFGKTAEITDGNGKRHAWTLVGSTEANLAEGRLSAESPVGQALRNQPVGSEIAVTTPKGDRVFKIEKLL